jgi:hypothetical protein
MPDIDLLHELPSSIRKGGQGGFDYNGNAFSLNEIPLFPLPKGSLSRSEGMASPKGLLRSGRSLRDITPPFHPYEFSMPYFPFSLFNASIPP